MMLEDAFRGIHQQFSQQCHPYFVDLTLMANIVAANSVEPVNSCRPNHPHEDDRKKRQLVLQGRTSKVEHRAASTTAVMVVMAPAKKP